MQVTVRVCLLILCINSGKYNSACTSFILKTINEKPVYGRTMEWGGFDLKSQLTVVPRDQPFTSYLTKDSKGMRWNNKYGFVAITSGTLPYATDGMNERGLSVGVLYFPEFAEYQDRELSLDDHSISNVDLASYILGNFDDINKVKNKLPTIRVVYNKDAEKAFDAPVPLHLVVTDQRGDSIVIEYIEKDLVIHDNVARVLTNAPTYDWHVLNLRNYTTLSAKGPQALLHFDHLNLKPFGAGSGMFGLPGDFMPTSRFVRAFAMTHTVTQLTSAEEAVKYASHILNNFDIPKGLIREGDSNHLHISTTQWSVVADLSNRRYYYWTEHNRRLRMLDLKTINWSENKIHQQPLDTKRKEDIEQLTI